MQIFDIQYIGSVNYFSKIIKGTDITISLCDYWYKMSFLNRCWILDANGKLELTVPVGGGRNQTNIFKEVKIDYSETWQKKHIRAIMTSYSKSPFFEYFFLDIENLISHKYSFLWELNVALLQKICAWLKHPCPKILHEPLNLLSEVGSIEDFRKQFTPKKVVQFPTLITYNQVFMNKHGFVPHLSILDLLFCEGPMAKQVLFEL